MNSLLLAPFAIFFNLDLAFNLLLIFAAPVVDALAFRACEFYEKIL